MISPMKCARVAIALVAMLAACTPKKPKAGDVCAAADEGTYVCTSTNAALLCKGERRVHRECRGPKGCAGDEHAASCDRTIGREGDACSERNPEYYGEWSVVCSENGGALLACHDGKLAIDTPCRGPKGCSGGGQTISMWTCDQTIGQVGDACNTHYHTQNQLGACSVDKKSSLACDHDEANTTGKLVVSKTCRGPKGCEVGGLGGDRTIPMPVCDGAD